MKKLFSFIFVLLLLVGCKEEILLPELQNGEDGISTIFAFDVLAPTDEHTNGGWILQIGADTNANGTLDSDEIQAELPLWHGNDGVDGVDGKNGLDGANGTVVTISEDGYWVLDGVKTNIKAIGEDGKDGADGDDGKSPYIGEDGYWYFWDVDLEVFVNSNIKAEGQDGADGADGVTPNIYFITQDVEPVAGHYNGGILVTMIWDKDFDQEIDEGEIVGSYTVWHGNDGADGADGEDGLTPFIDEEGYWWIGEFFTGVNAFGVDGIDGQDGADGRDGLNGFSPYISENGYWVIMIDGVIFESQFPATGPRGPRGFQGERGTVVGYTVTTAENCTTNGYRVTITIDEGLSSEFVQWFEVCDGRVGDQGLQGYNTLVELSEKDEETGCITITTGVDYNGNGVIDGEEELTDTQEVCDGLSTLVHISQKDEEGCIIIASGYDINRDGVLQREEASEIARICDGDDAIQPLVEVSDKVEGCVSITSGYDFNGNGVLDVESREIVNVEYICDGDNGLDGRDGVDGDDGLNTLVVVSEKDQEGCITISVGLDVNDNGVLEVSEVESTETICNGVDGRHGTDGVNGKNSLVVVSEKDEEGCITISVGVDTNNDGVLQEGEVEATETICDGVCNCNPFCDGEFTIYSNANIINESFSNERIPNSWTTSNSSNLYSFINNRVVAKGNVSITTSSFQAMSLNAIYMWATEYRNNKDKWVEAFVLDLNGNWTSLGKKEVTNDYGGTNQVLYWTTNVENIVNVRFDVTKQNGANHNDSKVVIDHVQVIGSLVVCDNERELN